MVYDWDFYVDEFFNEFFVIVVVFYFYCISFSLNQFYCVFNVFFDVDFVVFEGYVCENQSFFYGFGNCLCVEDYLFYVDVESVRFVVDNYFE